MAKRRQPRGKGRIKRQDRSEAQKRYLRRHFAEQAELDQDDQWSKDSNNRLSYFEAINPEQKEPNDTTARPTSNEEGFPF